MYLSTNFSAIITLDKLVYSDQWNLVYMTNTTNIYIYIYAIHTFASV